MYKLIVSSILSLLLTGQLYAQRTATLSATVADEATNETISGAIVSLTPAGNADQSKLYLSEQRGRINIPGLSFGTYALNISFLGYEDHTDTISIDKTAVNLGRIFMRLSAQNIDVVAVEGQAMRTTQRGDTVIYNADAFKVARDADAEGLLSKMPGITVIDGEVEAQGEQVKRIYVDGKEFFGDDVTSAIKNLPAEVIQRVEVYNKLSDQAEFTGIDDGEGFKALNFVTSINRGQFGKIYGGYGIKDKYIAGGNLNFFSGDSRISVLGLSNNLNQQNFAMEDILGAVNQGSGVQSRGGGRMRMAGAGGFMMRSQDGISKVHSIGVNYNDKWGKKFEVSASYFFNTTRNDNTRESERDDFSATELYNRYLSTTESWSRNYENRFTARLEYKINENHTLMMRPRLSFQKFESASEGLVETFRSDVPESPFRIQQNLSQADNHGFNFSNNLIYRAKLGKAGRTLTLDVGGDIGSNDRDRITSNLWKTPEVRDSLNRQRSLDNSLNWNVRASAVYTEPVTEKAQVSAEYQVHYRYSDSDNKRYSWLESLGIFDPDFSESESSIYNSGYITHRAGPGFNYGNRRDVMNFRIFYQHSSLTVDRDFPVPPSSTRRSFDNVVYSAMLNKSFNSTNTLRVHARSNTNNPSVNELREVVDLSDPQYISTGNPDLKPTYSHHITANYNRSAVARGTTFMAMAGFNIQSGYIAQSKVTQSPGLGQQVTLPNGEQLQEGAQFTRPVNMNGRWSSNAMVSFGMPVNIIRSNLNFNAGMMYTESPSEIDYRRNLQKGQYYTAGAVLGSNISDKVDFTVTYNGGYNVVKNSINRDGDNTYFSQGVSFRFKWEMWAGITLTGNGTYSQYKGITDDFNEKYFIANVYIGKKVFRNRRGEISVGVNDIFNQNTSFSRNVSDTYIENVRNSAIGRYVGFQFIYSLRNFGKSGSSSSRPVDDGGDFPFRGVAPPAGGRPPMGPGPGGPAPGM